MYILFFKNNTSADRSLCTFINQKGMLVTQVLIYQSVSPDFASSGPRKTLQHSSMKRQLHIIQYPYIHTYRYLIHSWVYYVVPTSSTKLFRVCICLFRKFGKNGYSTRWVPCSERKNILNIDMNGYCIICYCLFIDECCNVFIGSDEAKSGKML